MIAKQVQIVVVALLLISGIVVNCGCTSPLAVNSVAPLGVHGAKSNTAVRMDNSAPENKSAAGRDDIPSAASAGFGGGK